FIRVLPDQRADRSDNAGAFGAKLFHGLDRGFDNSSQRALPASMRRADHARVGIDEQKRSAVGRGDTDGETFGAGDDGVSARARGALPWSGRDRRIGRMALMHAEKMRGRHTHLLRHPATIFRDSGGIVVGAAPPLGGCIKANGDAAFAAEESVTQAGDGREQRRLQLHGTSALASGLSSANPAREMRLGSEIASTLNIDPMPPRPPVTSRFNAPEISSETSGEAFAISVIARVSMPSRLRKSPCGTGPWTWAPRSSAARTSAWKSTCAVTSASPGFFSGSVKLWRAMAWKVSPASLRR